MEVGELVGAYCILKELGVGGMGAVYLAEHKLLGRRAAIKVLLPRLSVDQPSVERFFQEARAVSAIKNPGIVEVYDFGYHETRGARSAYIVMELLEGETMTRRIARLHRLGVAEGLRFARQICMSLGAAHAKGIVHRDLKPENLFIVPDPAVDGGWRTKILDFGLAKFVGNDRGAVETRAGIAMGTPQYMSPEQCRASKEIDGRSDIYAMGCVMFTMLTGQPPFTDNSDADIVAAQLHQQPPLASSRVPELPPEVDDMIERCLAKAAADRFPSMTELVQAIEAAAQAPRRAAAATMRIDPTKAASGLSPPTMPDGYASEPAPTPTRHDGSATNPPPPRGAGVSTLTGAAGQRTLPLPAPQPPGGRRWLAVVIAAIALAGGGAAIVVLRPSGESRAPGGPSAATAPSEPVAPAAPPAPVAAPPAAVDTAAIYDAGVATASDAAVAEPASATAVTDPQPAASPPPRSRSHHKSSRPSTSGGQDASSTGSATPPVINRSD